MTVAPADLVDQSPSIFKQNHSLLIAFRAGEQDALDEVLTRTSSVVERALSTRLSWSQEGKVHTTLPIRNTHAEHFWDLYQDIYRKAFEVQTRQNFNPVKGDYEAYLFTIAKNRIIDFLRETSKSPEVLEKRDIVPSSNHKTPEAQFLDQQETEADLAVRFAVRLIVEQDLNEDDQHLIHAIFEEGLSYRTYAKQNNATRTWLGAHRSLESQKTRVGRRVDKILRKINKSTRQMRRQPERLALLAHRLGLHTHEHWDETRIKKALDRKLESL